MRSGNERTTLHCVVLFILHYFSQEFFFFGRSETREKIRFLALCINFNDLVKAFDYPFGIFKLVFHEQYIRRYGWTCVKLQAPSD